MELGFLQEIVTLFILSIIVILVCYKFKIPTIVGLLLTGLICGPTALGVVSNHEAVDIMAEVGVALLLFTIGMELSAKELIRMRRSLLIGGGGQVFFTVSLVTLLLFLFIGTPQAIVFGCLVTLSSTAIVLSIFQEKAQTESPQGRASLSVLIFQDLIIVPMILIFPLLAGNLDVDMSSSIIAVTTDIGAIIGIILFGKFILPRLMLSVVRTRSRELMLMTTLGVCLAIALLTASIGLSLSLGAFLAGLLLAESEYSLNVMENVLPFKNVFTSIFFISVGMLLDLNFFFANVIPIIGIAIFIIFIKIAVMVPVIHMAGLSLRTGIMVAFSLAQVGEFSFVLARSAMGLNLMDTTEYQMFLAASIMTMTLTPVFISYSPKIAAVFLKKVGLSSSPEIQETGEKADTINNHIIIIGFGIGGKSLAQVAKESNISYVISEMNPDTVKKFKATEPIRHGDASYPLVLEHLGIKKARVLAIMVTDPVGTRAIIHNARRLNPALHIVVRSRFLGEVKDLTELGANDVIPEEFETSIEVFARVLNHYLVPRQDIEKQISKIRESNYEILRKVNLQGKDYTSLHHSLPDLQFASFIIEENSILSGELLGKGTLRKDYQITVAGIRRNDENIINMTKDTELLPNDILYLFGSQENLLHVQEVFVCNISQNEKSTKEINTLESSL